MIEESAMSRNCTAHNSSSVSLPRRVTRKEPGWTVMSCASKNCTD